jgi:pilus assembly protein CpaF
MTDPDDVRLPLISSFASFDTVDSRVGVVVDRGDVDYFDLALSRLRERALETFSGDQLRAPDLEVSDWLATEATRIVSEVNTESATAAGRAAFADYDRVVGELLDALLGLGALEKLMKLPGVEDIAINGPDDIHYRDAVGWKASGIRFRSAEELEFLLKQAVSEESGRTLSPAHPILDGVMRNGNRISLVTRPVADPWPCAVIRIQRPKSITVVDMLRAGDGRERETGPASTLPDYREYDTREGMLTAPVATFFHMAVEAGINILELGKTGVGKTALSTVLLRMLPADRRVVLIEDTPEIPRERGNFQRLLVRPRSLEGLPEISQSDLIQVALRQRPDALTITEARGAEVFDLLKILRTGHRNGLASIHASSIEDLYTRVMQMLQESTLRTEVSAGMAASWIAKAFGIAITLEQQRGRRWISEVVEFTGGVEGHQPVRQPLFLYDPAARRLKCTGYLLTAEHERELNEVGHSYQRVIDLAREMGDLARPGV